MTLYTPANARGRVPVILLVNFGGGPQPPAGRAGAAPAFRRSAGRGRDPRARLGLRDGRLSGHPARSGRHVHPGRDRRSRSRAGQTQPAPDEWGTIGAWSWGVSRIIDYLETDRVGEREADRALRTFAAGQDGAVGVGARRADRRRLSRAAPGEMGAALARRDWGETVDDMAQNFPWQFAGNFQKWAGRWNEMPVDAHMLIALSAPRPVFITGGTADQWADPVGEFLAEVAAGPVYRLLGKKDLGVTDAAAARHAGHQRRSRVALSHRRPRGDAGRLDGVSGIPR